MKTSTTFWSRLRRPVISKQVLWLLGFGLVVIGTEFGLRAWDAQQKLEAELKSVRGRVQLLKSSADQANWSQRSAELSTLSEALLAQLWHAPSEAQAQAMLRDWLNSTIKGPLFQRVAINLQPVQAPTGTPTSNEPSNGETARSESSASQRLVRQAIRVRASLSFELLPDTLEQALQRIENGGQLASVDSLNASRRSRRVEMTVSVPVIVDGPMTATPRDAS